MAETLNKKELARIIAKKNGTTNIEELIKIDDIFTAIELEISKGNDVKIVGFGAFKSVKRKPRTIVNPKTSEQFKVGERTSLKFVAGKHLRDIVKNINS